VPLRHGRSSPTIRVALVALDEIAATGIVDQTCFPYTSYDCTHDGDCLNYCGSASDCANPRECPFACTDPANGTWDDRIWTIDSHSHLENHNDVAAVKSALVCEGPLVTCCADWGHCVAIVGWDNDSEHCRVYEDGGDGGCWILKNSWGTTRDGNNTWWHTDVDVFDDDVYHVDGFAWIPFEDHSFSRCVRNAAHYVDGVNPPANWTWP